MKRLLLATLLLCAPLLFGGSLSNCQNAHATSTTVASVTGFVFSTAGDGIFVWTMTSAGAAGTASVADNGSGGSQTYSNDGGYNRSTIAATAFVVTNATSAVNGSTITATWTVSGTVALIACEIVGAATASMTDGATITANGASVTSLASGSLTTANTGTDLLVYCTWTTTVPSTYTPGLIAGSTASIPTFCFCTICS
jgi:hypothetical protein